MEMELVRNKSSVEGSLAKSVRWGLQAKAPSFGGDHSQARELHPTEEFQSQAGDLRSGQETEKECHRWADGRTGPQSPEDMYLESSKEAGGNSPSNRYLNQSLRKFPGHKEHLNPNTKLANYVLRSPEKSC